MRDNQIGEEDIKDLNFLFAAATLIIAILAGIVFWVAYRIGRNLP